MYSWRIWETSGQSCKFLTIKSPDFFAHTTDF
jgi:hypothetical protein